MTISGFDDMMICQGDDDDHEDNDDYDDDDDYDDNDDHDDKNLECFL